jgi:hypothetical protein
MTFEARRTASDARIQFLLGGETGEVWIDDVRLVEHGAELFRRDFERGTVLLNGTRRRQSVEIGKGYARLLGEQAPRYQYILDDREDAGFTATGLWRDTALGTKEWHAIPPYYHAWNNRCHMLEAGYPRSGWRGEATWKLALRGPGTYTMQAWWAAAPGATTWTKAARYEVVAGGKVVASKTLDQTLAGDEWHTIAAGLKLDPAEKPFVRVRANGDGTLIADALHLFSAERYNDGTRVERVDLEPMDGIVLRRVK